MPVTYCPECDGDLKFQSSPRKGDMITCPSCGAYLEVVGLSPIELDWVLEEDQELEDWDLEDDELEEEYDD
jgi:lysine biosynthesis protein LysW